ncbi:MAG: FKBP-type peptidyl-prolyl cis-trans isomerase, partial [Fibrobacter sp.]|nr:FKBP-type peptidyl-prolyl cis-trans isomerase [Fibrobacter sp.]
IDSMAADSIRRQFANQVQEQMEEDQEEQAKEYKELSEAFLAQNKEREGVETTKSGLQYEILAQGDGPSAESSDSVRVSYTGMLVDSTVFDSTAEPVVLELARTIPGLAEGIKLMNQGSEYMFYVPSELAYGEQGIPPIIPPNAALIFRVKLDDVLAQEKKTGYKK